MYYYRYIYICTYMMYDRQASWALFCVRAPMLYGRQFMERMFSDVSPCTGYNPDSDTKFEETMGVKQMQKLVCIQIFPVLEMWKS